MNVSPDQIPESFQSYTNQFENNPEKALERLRNHIEKRSPGALAHFFLAWLYHRYGDRENAVKHAWIAKIEAPGSPMLARFHYYISHPSSFDAWEPPPAVEVNRYSRHKQPKGHPIQNLDSLIHKLSKAGSVKMSSDASEKTEADLAQASSNVEDIVTETLAVIYEKQKNYMAAINTFEKLKNGNRDKSSYYNKQIRRLKKKQEKEDE